MLNKLSPGILWYCPCSFERFRCNAYFNFSVSHLQPAYCSRTEVTEVIPLSSVSSYITDLGDAELLQQQTDHLSCSHPCKLFLFLHVERNDISGEPSHAGCLCAHGAGHGDIFPLFLRDGVGFLQPQAERHWGGVWDWQAGGGIRCATICCRGPHTVYLCEVLGRCFVNTILCQTERCFTEGILGLLNRSGRSSSWNIDFPPANTVLFSSFTKKWHRKWSKTMHSK